MNKIVAVGASLAIAAGISAGTPNITQADMQQPVVSIEAAGTNNTITDEDLEWLSKLIYAECGSDNCSDELQLAVGSVVLNRKNSPIYPDSIKKVIFDKRWGWQYGCVKNKSIYNVPNERAINNARYLLENGSVLPDNVLGQGKKVYLNGKYCSIQGVIFSYF